MASHVVVAAFTWNDALATRATSELVLIPRRRVDKLSEETCFMCSGSNSIHSSHLLIPSPNFFVVE